VAEGRVRGKDSQFLSLPSVSLCNVKAKSAPADNTPIKIFSSDSSIQQIATPRDIDNQRQEWFKDLSQATYQKLLFIATILLFRGTEKS